MIGTIDIRRHAANPDYPLPTLYAFVNSPSQVRIVNAPRSIGDWEITAVYVTANYPDNKSASVACTLTGGCWHGTLPASTATGTATNGFTVTADGLKEDGETAVTGYILGKGDVQILDADGTITAGETTYYIHVLDAQPTTPHKGDAYVDASSWRVYDGSSWVSLGGALGAGQYAPYPASEGGDGKWHRLIISDGAIAYDEAGVDEPPASATQTWVNAQVASEATARDAAIATAVAAETTARAAAVTAEAAARQSADEGLEASITAEETARASAVSAEASARASADEAEATARDAAISSAVAAEAASRQSADTALGSRIDGEASARASAVSAEATARDAAIAAAIATEVSARDAAIATETAARQTAVSDEAAARASAVSAETTARAAAVSAEASARQSADEDLEDAISAEATARASAVSAEATARQSADATLAGDIEAEEAARAAAVSAEATARATAVSDEATARANADAAEVTARNAAISSAVSAEAARATAAEGAIEEELDDEVSRATAAESSEAATRAAADATKVSLTGDQNIGGVKTFVSSPVVPAPTANAHAATKQYADAIVAAEATARESAVSAHTARTDNPHAVTAAQVGLGNCDNTSDANKPVSTATSTAISSAVSAEATARDAAITTAVSVSTSGNDLVHKSGAETITGDKTFNAAITAAGNIVLGNNKYICNSADSGSVALYGATLEANGSYLKLYGKGSSAGAGTFQLAAKVSDAASGLSKLVGTSAGVLTWAGQNVARKVLGVAAGDDGNVALPAISFPTENGLNVTFTPTASASNVNIPFDAEETPATVAPRSEWLVLKLNESTGTGVATVDVRSADGSVTVCSTMNRSSDKNRNVIVTIPVPKGCQALLSLTSGTWSLLLCRHVYCQTSY